MEKIINDNVGVLLTSVAVPEVAFSLKDFMELVFFGSSFFSDCNAWEWAPEENSSS